MDLNGVLGFWGLYDLCRAAVDKQRRFEDDHLGVKAIDSRIHPIAKFNVALPQQRAPTPHAL